MKNLFIFGLGIISISAAVALSSNAQTYYLKTNCNCQQNSLDPKQRSYSYNCCGEANLKNRVFSNRIAPYRYRMPSNSRLRYGQFDFSHSTRRHDVWYYDQYRDSKLSARTRVELNRLRHPELYPRNANLYQSIENVVRNTPKREDYISKANSLVKETVFNSIKRIDNNKYSFQIPTGYKLTSKGTYENGKSSLAFRIVKTNKECVQGDFQQCALNLGENFRREQDITKISQLEKDYRFGQTVKYSFDSFPTLVEGFKARAFGSSNVYFLFTALDPSDNSIIRIEGVSKEKDSNLAAETIHSVFETFQFNYQI